MFCENRIAKILDTVKEIRNLAASEKPKFFASSISFPLSEHHLEKLYKIDAVKGYDLSDVNCIELALRKVTRKNKIDML